MSPTSLPTENMDIASAAAAGILLESMTRVLANHLSPPGSIREAVLPLYGIVWNRAAMSRLGTPKLNSILAKLRKILHYAKRNILGYPPYGNKLFPQYPPSFPNGKTGGLCSIDFASNADSLMKNSANR